MGIEGRLCSRRNTLTINTRRTVSTRNILGFWVFTALNMPTKIAKSITSPSSCPSAPERKLLLLLELVVFAGGDLGSKSPHGT